MADLPLIQIVEDEKAIVRFLKASLADQFRVAVAETGRQGLMMIHAQPPDLVLLDLGLPDMDGGEVIDQLRGWTRLPIIVLSARDQERDKVAALDRGADDYLTKPFSVAELLARLRVALRHQARQATEAEQVEAVFKHGELEVDLEKRTVRIADAPVHLTPLEYRILTSLIAHGGKVLTHRMLLHQVWGPGHAEDSHQLRVHMANLRRKIERNAAQPVHIVTEQGVGYRLSVDSES